MKVKELYKLLKTMPKDAEICVLIDFPEFNKKYCNLVVQFGFKDIELSDDWV